MVRFAGASDRIKQIQNFIAEFGESSIPILLEVMKDYAVDQQGRIFAVQVLREIKKDTPAIVAGLVGSLKDPDPVVRFSAAITFH